MPILMWLKMTVEQPTEAAQSMLAYSASREFFWAVLTLISITSVFMMQFAQRALPPPSEQALTVPFLDAPLLLAILMWGTLVLLVFCVHYIGLMFGGTGRFEQSIMVMSWVQFLLIVSQLVQLAIAVVSVTLAAYVGLGIFVYWIWVFATFVAVLHGFKNRWQVLGGMGAS